MIVSIVLLQFRQASCLDQLVREGLEKTWANGEVELQL